MCYARALVKLRAEVKKVNTSTLRWAFPSSAGPRTHLGKWQNECQYQWTMRLLAACKTLENQGWLVYGP